MDLSAFSEVLEHDLRYLASEVRKTDTLAQQISGLFSHAEAANIKMDTERSILKLRSLVKENKGIDSLRKQQDIWKPFLQACELKNPKLLCAALSSIQKLLAHGVVTLEGCRSIIKALQQTEKANDDGVKLKMLQTILTMLQNLEFSAFEEGVCAVVSIAFRIHAGSKNNPAVGSTASATVRQAVALVLDHAVIVPSQTWSSWTLSSTVSVGAPESSAPPSPGAGSPAQTAALKLLSDLCSMCAGKSPNWLTCSTLPRVFILDLMEFSLLHRDKPFHQSAAFKTMLEERVCPLLKQLLYAVLECDLETLEPAALHEGRLVMRCATAILRKYSSLVPLQAVALLDMISQHCGQKHHPWKRVLCVQAIRQLCTEPKLLYHLFQLYDMKMDVDANLVHNTVKVLLNILNVFLKSVADNPEENLLGMLGGLYSQKACGKEVLQDLDNAANLNPGSEVVVAFFALDSLLLVVSGIESLTDIAVEAGGSDSPNFVDANMIKQGVCATLLDTIWRDVLSALSIMLSKCQTEAIILALLKGYQGVMYSAALLNLVTARDTFLASLCDFSLGNPEEAAGRQEEAARKTPSGQLDVLRGARSRGISSPRRKDDEDSTPLLPQGLTSSKSVKTLNPPVPTLPDGRETVVLSTKNVQTLRTVFNMAHRLADVLGPSWIYVMNVLYGLDCLVMSLHTQDASSLDASSLPAKAPSELYILSTAAKQLFVHSANMSGDAVASMLSALSKISTKALPTQASVTQPRLLALDRMVDIVLYNRYRISETWPILLSHIMDVVRTDNPQVRSAAIDALDRTITGSLVPYNPSNPNDSSVPSSPRSHTPPPLPTPPSPPSGPPFDGDPSTHNTAVQHMLLVALESLFNEEKEVDSRCGILRIVLHILQRHGEGLTRGWAPLLRLLESVCGWEEPETIAQAFPSVELMCSDFLTTMPKDFIARALDVLAQFAGQKMLLNVSLTAIVLLWNGCDLIAKALQRSASASSTPRMKLSASADTALWATAERVTSRQNSLARQTSNSSSVPSSPMTPATSTALSFTSSGQLGWLGGRQPPLPPSTPSNEQLAGTVGRAAGGSAFRSDLTESECSDLLMHLFRAFRNLSMDRRPEVRNSGVRTMFLAVGSHSAKLSEELWSTCLWDLIWTHLKYAQYMSETSSSQEAAGEELGKERGRAVMMIVHHSRNTEQKQWDETLILTLNGLTKMLRTYLPSVARLPGFSKGWEELMEINGEVLYTGRKGIAMAGVGLITCLIQTHPTLIKKWMLKSIFTCLEKGVGVMAVPDTHTQLQARVELVNCVGALYGSLKDDLEVGEMRQILRWLNMFARYPLAADEHANHPAVLPQIQKSVYNIINNMLPIKLTPIWSDIILLLCGFLCPLQLANRLATPTPTPTKPTQPSNPTQDPTRPLVRTPSSSSLNSISTPTSLRNINAPSTTNASLPSTTQSSLNPFSWGQNPSTPSGAPQTNHPSFSGWAPTTPSPSPSASLSHFSAMWGGQSQTQGQSQTSIWGSQSQPAGQSQTVGQSQTSIWGGQSQVQGHSQTSIWGGQSQTVGQSQTSIWGSQSQTQGQSHLPGSRAPSTTGSIGPDEGLVASFKPSYWDLAEMERSLGPSWMMKIIELLVTFYRDHAPWQVRASTFTPVVSCLSECMALRHLNPSDPLWRRAATAFIDTVAAGLPAINIAVVNDGAFVDDAWTTLATAFEQFILAENLPYSAPFPRPTGSSKRADREMGKDRQGNEECNAHGSRANASMPTSPCDSDVDSPTFPPPGNAAHGSSSTAYGNSNSMKDSSATDSNSSHPNSRGGGGNVSVSQVEKEHSTSYARIASLRENKSTSDKSKSKQDTDTPEVGTADADLTSGVLDTLTDSVLAACQFIPEDVRRRFLRVLDVGATETSFMDTELAVSNRLSHMCLRKLYVLCSRGSDSPGAALCQVEVAQRALPALLQRCKSMLEAYVQDEKRLCLNQSMPLWRVDEVVSVLDVLSVMTLAPSVVDAAAAQQPQLVDWLRLLRSRAVEQQAQQAQHSGVGLDRSPSNMSENRRERTHVLFLYQTLVGCVECGDKGIRVRLQELLRLVGRELLLMPSASATPLGSS